MITGTDPDEWPNFVRMFRMFKAGRSSGRGTGSLRFIRNIKCNSPHMINFRLSKVPKRNHADDRVRCLGDDGDTCAWHDWEAVANYIGDSLVDRGYSNSIYCNSSIHRLVSTIVMVANECNDVTKYSEFDTIGKVFF